MRRFVGSQFVFTFFSPQFRQSAKERKAAKVEIPQLMAQFNQSHPNLTLQQKYVSSVAFFHCFLQLSQVLRGFVHVPRYV
jgi:hypothetical protein